MHTSALIEQYCSTSGFWDEMHGPEGIRQPYAALLEALSHLQVSDLHDKEALANKLFINQGITFTVYSDNKGIERIFPFDILPRIITGKEWKSVEEGIKQRLKALNLFLNDIYHEQHIIRDGIIPAELIATCTGYNREVKDIKVPHSIYVHISGIDLIRGDQGQFYVLEDNLRTPSGVSYMLENREVTKRLFPDILTRNKVRMVNNYPLLLHNILLSLSPRPISNPTVVLLTPGIYNSAYYEHTFLARSMGIPLVEGRDLYIDNHKVFMKTTRGPQQVDVIYRRIDDEFIDPLVFRPDSVLGIPCMMSAYRKGNVALINAVGNGVADDKAVYAYVPSMIRYYLNEEPILPNVPTYQLGNEEERMHVYRHIENMVIKRTSQSGGYGMLMGNKASEQEIENFKVEIEKNPRDFIAQPRINLSTVPCLINEKFVPRHVDLRPYALYGPGGIQIVPGGLTRVALREGSLVVNSSQGGGSKDTWIIDE
ncbi:MAG: circularly permuted type 2 ATP-grasp protein [Bacteroidota bacterium]